MATIKQKRVVKILSENIRNGESTLGKIITKAGYKESVSKKPKLVTESKGFKEEAKSLTEQIEEERQAIIKRLKVTRNKAKYRDLMDGLDKTTKIYQVLTGGKTGNEPIIYTWKKRGK